MTLLIVVEDISWDSDLIDSACGLAAAVHWDVRAVHRQVSGEEPAEGDLGDVEAVALGDDTWGNLARLVAEAEVDCVAIGLRPSGRVLSAVGRAMVERAAVPVFLVRPGMRLLAELRRLLVPLEGTPSTSAAMLFTEAILCRPGREIVMLNVVTEGTPPAETGSLPAPRFIDQEQYEWSEWQNEFSMRFSQRAEGCSHRVNVRVGDPARVIAEEAQASEADVVVLTWKGTFAEGHGRVVRRLLEASPCPLLIVPAGWTEGPSRCAGGKATGAAR